jgi:hypothetical protein
VTRNRYISAPAAGCVAVLGFVGRRSDARASAKVLHTYGTSEGHEIANVIAVNASKLLPLLPPEYTLVPAASLGFGRPDQGLVDIANFRGFDPTVDNRTTDGPLEWRLTWRSWCYNCVVAPSLNLRYDKGAVGKLLFIR